MTRDEVQALLKRRLALTGDNFSAGMLDVWTEELADVDYGEAVVAMTRAGRAGRVQYHQFVESLEAHRRDRRDHHAETTTPACPDCDGTGWRDSTGEPNRHAAAGNTSVEPCDHRPVSAR